MYLTQNSLPCAIVSSCSLGPGRCPFLHPCIPGLHEYVLSGDAAFARRESPSPRKRFESGPAGEARAALKRGRRSLPAANRGGGCSSSPAIWLYFTSCPAIPWPQRGVRRERSEVYSCHTRHLTLPQIGYHLAYSILLLSIESDCCCPATTRDCSQQAPLHARARIF